MRHLKTKLITFIDINMIFFGVFIVLSKKKFKTKLFIIASKKTLIFYIIVDIYVIVELQSDFLILINFCKTKTQCKQSYKKNISENHQSAN